MADAPDWLKTVYDYVGVLPGQGRSMYQAPDAGAPAGAISDADILRSLGKSDESVTDKLKRAMSGALDRRYESVRADNEVFKNNPVGHIMKSLLFGANAMGAGGPPVARPSPPLLPGGRVAPPPGEYFQPPSSPPLPPDGPYTPAGHMGASVRAAGNPVEGMKDYGLTAPYVDPKILASTYRNMMPKKGSAAFRLENQPSVSELNPHLDAAALLRRNEALVDAMSDPNNLGPWGMRR